MSENEATGICPECGKPTKRKYCSKECFHAALKKKSPKATNLLAQYDNTNICYQCKKPMPMDRYSMYCEECELMIEDN